MNREERLEALEEVKRFVERDLNYIKELEEKDANGDSDRKKGE